MTDFTPLSALAGGALLGLSATLLLLLTGRVAGVSGIVGGLLRPARNDVLWRALFVAGLIGTGAAAAAFAPDAFVNTAPRGPAMVVAAGLLVGFGTRLGCGCTSGHGVCGLSRLSVRSLVAVLLFMASGAATVFVTRHLLGGAA